MRKVPRATGNRRDPFLFAVRSPDRATRDSLVRAAKADNRTVSSEIDFLLDLREHYASVSVPDHPLAQPPEVLA